MITKPLAIWNQQLTRILASRDSPLFAGITTCTSFLKNTSHSFPSTACSASGRGRGEIGYIHLPAIQYVITQPQPPVHLSGRLALYISTMHATTSTALLKCVDRIIRDLLRSLQALLDTPSDATHQSSREICQIYPRTDCFPPPFLALPRSRRLAAIASKSEWETSSGSATNAR